MKFKREDILSRLRANIEAGKPIIGAGAGTGISAKCEEAGGVDLIVIYNSGRFRMAGRGSIVRYYRQRWLIETAFRDTKQHFGFDKYRVKSRKSINRLVQLSFLATCITQLIFNATCAKASSITVEKVCRELGIDWYRPTKLTRGLMVQYLCAFIEGRLFSQTNHKDTYSPDIQQNLDNAACKLRG